MSRMMTLNSQSPFKSDLHLRPHGDFFIVKDLNEEIPRPPVIRLGDDLYYRFMNFLYSPQPPESLSPDKVIELCDLRLELMNHLVDRDYNRRIVMAIATYLKASYPGINAHAEEIRVLDFGCGSGLSLQLILEHFPHLNMVGVDISKKAVHLAQEQGLAAIQTFPEQKLPFEPASFDLICANFVMHFTIEIDTLIELRRVLHPTGKYVFNLFQRNFDTVEEELREAGFREVEIITNLQERGGEHLIVSCSGFTFEERPF